MEIFFANLSLWNDFCKFHTLLFLRFWQTLVVAIFFAHFANCRYRFFCVLIFANSLQLVIPDRWIGSLSLSTICGNQSSLSPNTQRRLFGTSKKTPCTVVYAQATSADVVVYVSSDFGPVSPAVSPVCLLLLYPPCKTHWFCRVNLNSGTMFVVYI